MSLILIEAAKEDEKLQSLLKENKNWEDYVNGILKSMFLFLLSFIFFFLLVNKQKLGKKAITQITYK
jgi:hypothetical protein